MARIISHSEKSVFQIQKWLGLNESQSGDAGLKYGEAAEMRNFQVTREGDLRVRPGVESVLRFPSPIRGLWNGMVGEKEKTVCACGGKLWSISVGDVWSKEDIGNIADEKASFFSFGGKLYILTESRFLVWTGYGLSTDVAGYRPMVAVTVPPAGGGALLEQANKLTGAKRARFSPDGTATTFTLPEKNILTLDYVRVVATGADVSYSSASLRGGTVTLKSAPAKGVDTLEIGWDSGVCDRATVTGMRFCELYSGATNNRVFLYGNGSNQALYSGIDYDGRPNAEYFPDLNVLDAGSENTEITGMIRHFSSLLVFKTDGAYGVQSGSITTADGHIVPSFYVTPVSREVGNVAPGQVCVVDNNPLTLHAGSIYEWRTGSYLGADERSAKRISDRVGQTLGRMDLSEAVCYDDGRRQEYYVCCGTSAVLYNYASDVFYLYTDFPAVCFMTVGQDLYAGTSDGRICRVSNQFRSDDTAPIDAYWRSGSMGFGREQARKYSSLIWISMKPESGARLTVTARTDRKSDYPEKVVYSSLAGYRNVNYAHWSYATNRQPKVLRVKLKVKKAAYYQLILESCSASTTATVLSAELQVQYTGNVK